MCLRPCEQHQRAVEACAVRGLQQVVRFFYLHVMCWACVLERPARWCRSVQLAGRRNAVVVSYDVTGQKTCCRLDVEGPDSASVGDGQPQGGGGGHGWWMDSRWGGGRRFRG